MGPDSRGLLLRPCYATRGCDQRCVSQLSKAKSLSGLNAFNITHVTTSQVIKPLKPPKFKHGAKKEQDAPIHILTPGFTVENEIRGRQDQHHKEKSRLSSNKGVLAQVSCELVCPKPNRPTEGVLFFNLELSPMAAPGLEPGRQSELLVSVNRLLERCLRDSKCIDTESLCVVAGEKVWQIRLDMHLLNHDGNITDAASIAGIVALCHFRRPDVSVQGEEVTVYTPEERDPVPLSIHHMPICVSFAFFHQGTYLLVDPSEREERVMDGLLVIAMNKHREICTIQSSGVVMLVQDQILRCSKITAVKVAEITELIQKALENDHKASFANPILHTPGTAQIGEGIENSWGDLEESEKEEAAEEEGESEAAAFECQKTETEDTSVLNETKKDEPIVVSDSEEEEVVILEPQELPRKTR
ncbi:Exosome complex component RRP45 [Willisornis vidua]|uniref:Exosome complex component RRP45 n=1 Tax=Willisornis vidua TaxID=1566151 RepID=A0ABQ9CPH8_9PASS|nr:Exosome complex component RRP45 [Willisornis vidua]